MHDLLELPKQLNLSIFSTSCEVASGKYMPYIDPHEAMFVNQSCRNPHRKNIISCKDDYVQEFIEEVGGLALDLPLSNQTYSLPRYIPIYNERVELFPQLFQDFSFVGLTLGNIFTSCVSRKAGALHEDKSIRYRSNMLTYPCFKNSKVLLFSTGPDTLIEHVWNRRRNCDLYKWVQKMGFNSMTGFNFSLIEGECALAQSLNMKRSLYSSYEMEQHGICTIPHVYALSQFQINRWIDWFEINKNVQCFTVNCQLHTSHGDYSILIRSIQSILKAVPTLHVILQGFRIDYIRHLKEYINRLHFAETYPSKMAQSNFKINYNMDSHKCSNTYDRTSSKAELIAWNFRERNRYIDYLTAA